MIWLPRGVFQLGSPRGELGRNADEQLHRAEVEDMLAVGETEVTVGQFEAFVEATRYRTQVERETSCLRVDETGAQIVADMSLSWREPGFATSDHHPVTCVSWNDARAYAAWLAGQTGKDYRLPTELEWEYAARAGSQSSRYWGDDPDAGCDFSNAADSTVLTEGASSSRIAGRRSDCRDEFLFAAPVAVLQPNAFGLHDMLGNLAEWTCSFYDRDYSGAEARCADQAGLPESGPRVIRGGSWLDPPSLVRAAARDGFPPQLGLNTIGFRVVRPLAADEAPRPGADPR
jgi:formylglycine-generating enzyme required for sulfatase activity